MTKVGKATEYLLIRQLFRFIGDRLRILESARETEAGSLRGEYVGPPGGNVPEQIHPSQEEGFEMVSGTLGVRVGGRKMILSPGQGAVGPPGVFHKWWNLSNDGEEVCYPRIIDNRIDERKNRTYRHRLECTVASPQ